ncbi:hypothetical protein BZM27_54955, partial [Paraburkholderia steynii]
MSESGLDRERKAVLLPQVGRLATRLSDAATIIGREREIQYVVKELADRRIRQHRWRRWDWKINARKLKAYIDGLGGLWFQGKLNGKVGSGSHRHPRHRGNEATLLPVYTFDG